MAASRRARGRAPLALRSRLLPRGGQPLRQRLVSVTRPVHGFIILGVGIHVHYHKLLYSKLPIQRSITVLFSTGPPPPYCIRTRDFDQSAHFQKALKRPEEPGLDA